MSLKMQNFPPPLIRRQRGGSLWALGLTLLLTSLITRPGRAAALNPDGVGWSEIRMTATKLMLTAEATLAWRVLPGSQVLPGLMPVSGMGFAGLLPGKEAVELIYDTRVLGRNSRLTLLMDPFSGAALQRTQHNQNGKQRWRCYRFGVAGAYQRSREPASEQEKTLPPADWTRTGEDLRAYPVPPGTQPVVEPTGLLYAIAAAPLTRTGDTLEVLVFRRRDTQTVHIEVLTPRTIEVDYLEQSRGGSVRRVGKVEALRLSLVGLPLPGASEDEDELELLGLRGKLELLLDPITRAPLQLSGQVKVLGTLTLRLAELRPRTPLQVTSTE